MPALNSRQVAIARALLSASGPVSARSLGAQLGISARVVRYNLPMIAFWLSSHEATLTAEAREGIRLEVSGDTRTELLQRLDTSSPERLLLAPRERRQVLLFELLTSWDYRTKRSIQHKLAISSSTLYRDLTEIESWCANNQLFLERRPRLGVRVVGREEDQRQATITLLLEFDLAGPLLDCCLSDSPPDQGACVRDLSAAQSLIVDEVLEWHLREAWQDVGTLLRGLSADYTDFVHLTLALYWAIMRRRLARGCAVHLPLTEIEALQSRHEYRTIAEHNAVRADHRPDDLIIPAAEVAQLVRLLTASLAEEVMLAPPPAPDVDSIAHSVTHRLIEHIDPRIGTSPITADVVARLESHLSRSIARFRHGLPVHNPLGREVRQAYPELWQSISALLDEENLNRLLPEGEIAFITMYIALAERLLMKSRPALRVIIACPTGGITVQMLVHRLGEELPEVEIVDVIPISRLGDINRQTADAVISTANLSTSPLPVITVSPLINQQDLALLRRQLNLAH